jgi:4-hydroxythreonine-4-phosphate dehydrogenase
VTRAGAAAAACIDAVALGCRGAGRPSSPRTDPQGSAGGRRRAFPGHTEMLQAAGAGPGRHAVPVRMMLANDELRVVLVTIHVALRAAIDASTSTPCCRRCASPTAGAAAWGQAGRASPWPG